MNDPDRPVRTTSLRRRVVLSVITLLLAVLVGLGLTVNYLLQSSLRADLRQRLIDRAGYAAVLQAQGVTDQTLADRMAGQGVFAVLAIDDQRYVGQESNPGTSPGPRGRPPSWPRPATAPQTRFSEDHGNLTATVTLANGTLTLSTSEAAVARTMHVLRQSELIAGAVTLLLTALILILLVRAALRPLDRMAALAWRIRAGVRGRRLRPTDPKTELGRTAIAIDGMLDALEAAERDARTAQARSEDAEQRMRQFLGDASHDLRTPLAGVIASAERLLREPLSRYAREARLVDLVRQAQRASRLVDDLLVLSQLDAGQAGQPPFRPQPVDLVTVIGREVDAVRLRAGGRTVATHLPEALPILGDAAQLHRILANLLDNAVAATADTGRIELSLELTGATCTVTVTDDGVGVPSAERDRIFDRFVRLSQSRSGTGTGLGLAIARELARAHGGDLRCAASEHGARFRLILPLAGLPKAQPTTAIATTRVPATIGN